MANYPSQDFYCACAAGFFAVLSSGNDTPTHLKGQMTGSCAR